MKKQIINDIDFMIYYISKNEDLFREDINMELLEMLAKLKKDIIQKMKEE